MSICATSSVGDEGRPFEVGFQQQASNHSKLLQSKGEVVSVREKVSVKISGVDQKDE